VIVRLAFFSPHSGKPSCGFLSFFCIYVKDPPLRSLPFAHDSENDLDRSMRIARYMTRPAGASPLAAGSFSIVSSLSFSPLPLPPAALPLSPPTFSRPSSIPSLCLAPPLPCAASPPSPLLLLCSFAAAFFLSFLPPPAQAERSSLRRSIPDISGTPPLDSLREHLPHHPPPLRLP